MRGPITNQMFADSDENFRAACAAAGIPPTRRQASKFKLGFGRAYEAWRDLRHSNGKVVEPSTIDVSIDVPVNVLAK